jgi:hypothetical protein
LDDEFAHVHADETDIGSFADIEGRLWIEQAELDIDEGPPSHEAGNERFEGPAC